MVRRFFAALLAALALVGGWWSPAAAASFVDLTLGDVRPEERVAVLNPQPVQLLVTFQTEGAANATATRFVKPKVVTSLTATRVFSQVSDTPVPGGAVIQITINNMGQADAASQGFVTGLTFGLRGSLVADTYEAKLEYIGGDGQAQIVKTARHRLYTRIGNHAPPENALQVRNIEAALDMIIRQLVDRMVTDLTLDPAFGIVPAVAVEAAPAAVAPAIDAAASPAAAEPAVSVPAVAAPSTPAAPGDGAPPPPAPPPEPPQPAPPGQTVAVGGTRLPAASAAVQA